MSTQFQAPVAYANDIWRLRHFWLSLVQKDLRARYRHSIIGVGWSMLRPLALTTVFCIVFAELFHVDIATYVPFLLSGLAAWQFLSECLMCGCHSFTQSSAYIKQQPVPLAIFPLRPVLGAGLHAMISLAMAVLVTALFQQLPSVLSLAYLFPAILLCLLLGWASAIISGMLNVHFPDTHHLLDIAVLILFYLTPVMYPLEKLGARSRFIWLVHCNPVSHVLATIRDPILTGHPAPLVSYAVSLSFTVAICLLAIYCLRKLERTLVFWV